MENLQKQKKSLIPMISVTVLFFMWGFITSLNDILIPYFKEVYKLSHFEANIVQFAFFVAYFVVSLIFYFWTKTGKDPIHRYGYKRTLMMGLAIESLACFFFALVARLQLGFGIFLVPLFLMGTGLTFLQIAANPFVSIIGPSDTASSRLNLTQAFNSLGTTLGPALGGYFILTYFTKDIKTTEALYYPYFFLAILLLLLNFYLNSVKISAGEEEEQSYTKGESIFKKPYVLLGALGIFFYVGAEVAVGSNLVSYMKDAIKMPEDTAAALLSYYWGGAMIGRFLGAVSLSKAKTSKKFLYMVLLAIASFIVIFVVNYFLKGLTFTQVWYFLIFVALNFVFFYLGRGKAALTLSIFTIVNIALLFSGIFLNGQVAVWSLLAIGLFNSIMWSNVFTLAIDGLGSQTASASSILIMMILGGAVIPPLQGLLADLVGIKLSYFLPMLCYIYLCFYGLIGYKCVSHKRY